MRKLVVHEFISLDGVIQAPGSPTEDTEGGFAYGGWTLPYWHDDMGAQFGQALMETDAFLLGRKTWQGHAAAFGPNPAEDPFGPDMKKYVVSSTLKSVDAWQNSILINSGSVMDEVRKLKQQPGKNIAVDGSSVLVHALIENNLVDEYQLHIYPLVLGMGKRLFPAGKHVSLKLIETCPVPTGVVYNRYQPA